MGTRCSPAFAPGSTSLESRGMCTNSFSKGLTPVEMFFHNMGGRQGLIDTAVKTGDSGTIFRRIGEILKNIKVSPDGSLRNGTGGIVQSTVYEDGFNRASLIRIETKTKSVVPTFIDVNYLAEQINQNYS
jgi:DNA-directed RNA polymerase beta' subunit